MESPIASSSPLEDTLVLALRVFLQATTGHPVELLQTHISWVLLTETLAYKLKKPVSLPFVDFSTLALRRHFCAEELRLNRRMAPSLYLDVVPICGTVQEPRIGGGGAPIDYAVRMRRFPSGALLAEMLDAGQLHAPDLALLAQRLADFHRDAPATPLPAAFGTPAHVVQAVFDVLAQLDQLCDTARIAALRLWVDGQAHALHGTWLARRRDGAVRECHGDLHLANAVKIGEGDVTAFDCIEFDPALRWTDVMGDVAFLTMDLQAHGRPDLAYGFLDDYLQCSGDYAGVAVLRFYEVYRALVRTLVASLRSRGAQGPASDSGPDYLACAELLAAAGAGKARLLITHGLSGSGKSTLARALVLVAGAIRLRSDVERKRLFGLGALQRSANQGVAIYTPDATRQTFESLLAGARTSLEAGYPVIVDAAFLRHDERQAFRQAAQSLGAPFAILDCCASEARLRARVVERCAHAQDASEADLAVLEQQLVTQQPLDADERAAALVVVTDEPVDMAALWLNWRAKGVSRRTEGEPLAGIG